MFIKITMEEFKAYLNEYYPDWEYGQSGFEMTADVPTKDSNTVIRIYTSVDVRSEVTRNKGADAIRFVLFDKVANRAFGKGRRVYRTAKIGEDTLGIWNRIMERIDKMQPDDTERCEHCGSVKVLREPKPGQKWKPFMGCLNYRVCKETRGKKKVIGDTEHVTPTEDTRDLVPTKDYKLLKYGFKHFNPVQSAVYPLVAEDNNLVISAATSAGKTIAAELVMGHIIKKLKKKVVYLSPLKSLTEEKHHDWLRGSKRFADFNVCILTGDYVLTTKKMKELKEADVIVMTSEMTDSRTRRMKAEKNEWLFDVGLIIVDESHIITTNRGHAVESGLLRFTKLNSEARIILLSATMPNVGELGAWLSSLNGKKSTVIDTDWRPVELEWHYVPHLCGRYNEEKADKIRLAKALAKEKPDEKFLIFVHDKGTGRAIVSALEDEGVDAFFHNADLPLEDRLEIEKSFEDRDNGERVLVSTSTLAWGRNLPARNVVIAGVHRGLSEIDPIDIPQMGGRAGRYGIDPKGDVYFICPEDAMETWRERAENPDPIRSRFHDFATLCFHILAEIQTGNIWNAKSFLDWYARTLAYFQDDKINEQEALDILGELKKLRMVEEQGSRVVLTGLGRVSAWLYYDPYDIAAWYHNFEVLFQNPQYPTEVNAYALSWAIGNVPSNDLGYEPKYVSNDYEVYCNKIFQYGLKTGYTRKDCFAAYMCLTEEWDSKRDRGPVASNKRSLRYDAKRIAQALKLIDTQYARWNRSEFLEVLPYMVMYAVPPEIAPLCAMKGIGGVRAKKLWDAGIKSIIEFIKKKKTARKVLGNTIYKEVMESLKI